MVQKRKVDLPAFSKPSLQQVIVWRLPLIASVLVISMGVLALLGYSFGSYQPKVQLSPFTGDDPAALYLSIIIILGGSLVVLVLLLIAIKLYFKHAARVRYRAPATVVGAKTPVSALAHISPSLIAQARALIAQARGYGYSESMIVSKFHEQGWKDNELAELLH